jgi:hypothetical protein
LSFCTCRLMFFLSSVLFIITDVLVLYCYSHHSFVCEKYHILKSLKCELV